MSAAQVEKHIREEYDGQDLLDALPPHDTLVWIPLSIYPQAFVPLGIALGTSDGRNIIAFCRGAGDKAFEIRYCSAPIESSPSPESIESCTQDFVLRLNDLKTPFKYIDGATKSRKRKVSYVIKWYFMTRMELGLAITGNLDEWCKVFYRALGDIQSHIADEPGRSTRSDARGRNDAVQENPEASGRRAANGLAWARQTMQDTNVSALATSSHDKRQHREGGIMTDFDTLCHFLEEEGRSHLLENITSWKGLKWYDGNITPDSLPYKLVVGKTTQDKANIYAHLRVVDDAYVVQFWSNPRGDKANGITLATQDMAAHTVFHPFVKTFRKTCVSLNKTEEEQLEILVKWCFIAGGKVCNLLKLEPIYPDRFVDTLKSISSRAHNLETSQARPSSHRPPISSPIDEDSVQASNLRSPIVSPNFSSTSISPNFPALAVQNGQLTPSRSAESRTAHKHATAIPQSLRQVAHGFAQSASRTPQRAQLSPSKRGTKRTADDASLDGIIAEVNKLDEKLEFHDFKKDAFEERKVLDSQDFKAKQIEKEREFEEDIEARRKKFKEDQVARQNEWEDKQTAKNQKFAEDWQRERDRLAKVREEARQRRRQKRLKNWRESGMGIKGVNGVNGE